MGLQFIGL